jgi:predicted amidohydrolase
MSILGRSVPVTTMILMMMPALFISACSDDSTESAPSWKSVRVAGIVLKWTAGDPEANWRHAEGLIREAASGGAKIVCTPESFLDGYAIRDSDLTTEQFRALAEPVPEGEYCRRMRRLADELDIYLIAAITELDGEKVYNSAVLIGPDGAHVGTYRKKFLWVDEEEKYSAGNAFPAFETPYGKVGMMICSDRRQPSAVEELTRNGADLVFCPAGGGYGKENDETMSRRSKEGKVPIVFVHPVRFLVTAADGSIVASDVCGLALDHTDDAEPGVVQYCDVPL